MDNEAEKELKIQPIIKALTKRLWIIILITVGMGAVGTYYHNNNEPIPMYSATSSIIIEESNVDMSTLKVFITEPIVLEELSSLLSLDLSVSQLRNMITAIDVEGSKIIQLSVTDTSPDSAVAIANSLGTVVPNVVNDRLGESEINLLSEALLEESVYPINSQSNSVIYISIILGAIIGIGVALLLDTLDYKIKSEREVESVMELPVLGTVSKIGKKTLKKHPGQRQKSSLRGETIA